LSKPTKLIGQKVNAVQTATINKNMESKNILFCSLTHDYRSPATETKGMDLTTHQCKNDVRLSSEFVVVN
jgi:hypothetical protein